jgi:hypothetical protein
MKAFFKHSIYAALLAMPLLTGCSNQDGAIPEEMVPLQVYAEIEDSDTETRATEKTAWANEDAIGVTSSLGTNVKYTYSSSGWTGSSTQYFTSTSNVSFSAYYPYVSSSTTAQTTELDYLYATATASNSSPKATFTFAHKMSKLQITLSGFSGVTSSTISGLKSGGSFTPSTGTIAMATGTASNRSFTSGTAIVLFPQTTTTSITVTIVAGTGTYKSTISIANGIKSGYSYVYTIKKP